MQRLCAGRPRLLESAFQVVQRPWARLLTMGWPTEAMPTGLADRRDDPYRSYLRPRSPSRRGPTFQFADLGGGQRCDSLDTDEIAVEIKLAFSFGAKCGNKER